ncbi:MAG TPA: hypothetical protein VK974_09375 [Methylophilaceae bacterium]|nr:hypothetical protein [Methylophilaceae bacterium]
MNDEKLSLIASTLNDLLVKQMVIDIAIQELISLLANDDKEKFATNFRQSSAELMQENSEAFSQAMDNQFSLSVASYLEASGNPPNY